MRSQAHKRGEAAYRAKYPERVISSHKRYNLNKQYGITLEQYNELVLKQNNLCAICKQPETVILRGKQACLSVDHCHKTKKIRALLCQNCNRALGMLKENYERFTNAILYLTKYQENFIPIDIEYPY
jgi:hypothetical protein